MKSILITVPDPIKAKLDALRAQGYTLNGYVRAVLERELADRPANARSRKGHTVVRYRKPGGPWRSRTVSVRQLEATVLRLENQGAEIVTQKQEKGGLHGTTR